MQVYDFFFNQTLCRSGRNVSCHRLVFFKIPCGRGPTIQTYTSWNIPSSKTPNCRSLHKYKAACCQLFFLGEKIAFFWGICVQYITYRGRPTHSMYILVEIAHAAVALPLASCENRKMIATIHIQKTGFLSWKNPKEWWRPNPSLSLYYILQTNKKKGGRSKI